MENVGVQSKWNFDFDWEWNQDNGNEMNIEEKFGKIKNSKFSNTKNIVEKNH